MQTQITRSDMDTTGIYIIYFDSPDKCYIGQSVRVETRLRKHLEMLKGSYHYNYKLQEAYSNNGSNVTLELLQQCNPSELNHLESSYIEEFNCLTNGYNIMSGGDSTIGYASSRSKYTRNQLIYLYNLLADETLTNLDISKISGLPVTLVESLAYGKRHLWLREEFPELAQKIDNIVHSKIRSSLCNDYNARNGVTFLVTDPDGIVWEFSNISKFAEEHGLNKSHLNQVILGKEAHHKNWRKGVQNVI